MTRRVAALLLASLPACSAVAGPTTPAPLLGAYFDCLRERGEAVVSAHRAGPAAGLPENALETIRATLDADPHAVLEIDVQRSADGVLFLIHDDRLERLTTGRGTAAERRWRDLSRLRLKDPSGTVTPARIPRLADALRLARAEGAVVQLDMKDNAPVAEVVAAVRSAGAEGNAVLIVNTPAEEEAAIALAPDLMISANVYDSGDMERLLGSGVDLARLLAFTGTRAPSPALFAELRQAGVEPMFGTLGRPGRRIDDRWLSDGDPAEYLELARDGVVVIATDAPRVVADVLPDPTCRISP